MYDFTILSPASQKHYSIFNPLPLADESITELSATTFLSILRVNTLLLLQGTFSF
jgi:hypothetical protein